MVIGLLSALRLSSKRYPEAEIRFAQNRDGPVFLACVPKILYKNSLLFTSLSLLFTSLSLKAGEKLTVQVD
jgi:hypothetical protein